MTDFPMTDFPMRVCRKKDRKTGEICGQPHFSGGLCQEHYRKRASRQINTPRIGNCERCGFHTKLTLGKDWIGNFLGKPVYDDLYLCDLCLETQGMEGDKLLLYVANLIFSRVYYQSSQADQGYKRDDN